MTRRFLFLCTILLAAGTALLAYALRARLDAAAEFRRQAELAREQAEQIHRETVVPQQQKIPRGSNFVAALERFGLSALEANEASAAAQRAFNLRQVRAGHMITVGRSVEGQLRSIEYQIDPDHRLRVVPRNV